jgi:hypothetical protein
VDLNAEVLRGADTVLSGTAKILRK